ncbi:MAG: DUF362 domain-containing protein [archaeon GB-1867-035]|nr:DUF362 domain-containing protein [Candidatus Culexmicrobium profundum]
MSKVAIVKSKGHYHGVKEVLELLKEEIKEKIRGRKRIVIKPNFVSTTIALSATHVEAVKALLDFISNYTSSKIIIAEGPASAKIEEGLRNYDYYNKLKEYDVEYVDLNEDDYIKVKVWNSNLEKKLEVRIAKTIVNSDFRISICRPKTHNTVIVTLTIKNIAVGSLINHDKSKIHKGYKAINLTIAELTKLVKPHLSIIDGYIGMQGNGPVSGEKILSKFAVAGLDPVAVDAVTAKLMGFNPLEIGYLYYLDKWGEGVANIDKIEIIGGKIEDFSIKFKPHRTYLSQKNWKIE